MRPWRTSNGEPLAREEIETRQATDAAPVGQLIREDVSDMILGQAAPHMLVHAGVHSMIDFRIKSLTFPDFVENEECCRDTEPVLD